MTTNNHERIPFTLEVIEEKQKTVMPRKELSDPMLRDAIMEHGIFAVSKPKHRKHHSEPVLTVNCENLDEKSEHGDEEKKLTFS